MAPAPVETPTPTPNIAFSQQQGWGRATHPRAPVSKPALRLSARLLPPPLPPSQCLDTTFVHPASPEASGTALFTDEQTPRPGRSASSDPGRRGCWHWARGEKVAVTARIFRLDPRPEAGACCLLRAGRWRPPAPLSLFTTVCLRTVVILCVMGSRATGAI